MLNTAKQLLTHRIDEESSFRCKTEAELRDLARKYTGAKQTLEVEWKMVLCTSGLLLFDI